VTTKQNTATESQTGPPWRCSFLLIRKLFFQRRHRAAEILSRCAYGIFPHLPYRTARAPCWPPQKQLSGSLESGGFSPAPKCGIFFGAY